MSVAFTSSPFALSAGVLFTGLLAAACATDIRSRRIPNALVLTLAAAGIGYSAIIAAAPTGILRGLATLVLGLALWIPLYAFGKMGAGDVKLFAAASAWLSPAAVLNAALLSALIGGVLAIVWMYRSYGGALATLRLSHAVRQPTLLRESLPVAERAAQLPYGIAMALGLSLAAWLPRLPF